MPRKLTTEDFIEKSKKIHKNIYDYSSVNYINSRNKVKIICKKHGEFTQRAANHLLGIGCKKCYFESRKIGLKKFIELATLKHNNKYDYSNVKYINSITNIEINCPIHGKFYQQPRNHLNGNGCKKCVGLFEDKNSFLEKAKNIHGDEYDYSKVKYKNSYTKIEIICKTHGSFFQKPSVHHWHKSGCPQCNKIGFSRTQWVNFCNINNLNPTLYIIKCWDEFEKFIKIGITTRSVFDRINLESKFKYNYRIIKKIKGDPAFIWEKEKKLHALFKDHKHIPKLKFGGMTECFNILILNHDKKLF